MDGQHVADHVEPNQHVEAEGTAHTRQVRVRGGHRSTVTRLVNELEGALRSADLGRLKQLKQSLQSKITLLSSLDEKILSLVGEDQVEAEIQQADLVRERAEVAIFSIDEALSSRRAKNKNGSQFQDGSWSPPDSDSDSDDSNLLRPSQASNAGERNPSYYPTLTSDEPFRTRPLAQDQLPFQLSTGQDPSTLLAVSHPPTPITVSHNTTDYFNVLTQSMSDTYVTYSNGVTTAPSLRPIQTPVISCSGNVMRTPLPNVSIPSARTHKYLPDIPDMVVYRGPPPLLSVSTHCQTTRMVPSQTSTLSPTTPVCVGYVSAGAMSLSTPSRTTPLRVGDVNAGSRVHFTDSPLDAGALDFREHHTPHVLRSEAVLTRGNTRPEASRLEADAGLLASKRTGTTRAAAPTGMPIISTASRPSVCFSERPLESSVLSDPQPTLGDQRTQLTVSTHSGPFVYYPNDPQESSVQRRECDPHYSLGERHTQSTESIPFRPYVYDLSCLPQSSVPGRNHEGTAGRNQHQMPVGRYTESDHPARHTRPTYATSSGPTMWSYTQPAAVVPTGAPLAPRVSFSTPNPPNYGAHVAPDVSVTAPHPPNYGTPAAPDVSLAAPNHPNYGTPVAPDVSLAAPTCNHPNYGARVAPDVSLAAPNHPNYGTPVAPDVSMTAPNPPNDGTPVTPDVSFTNPNPLDYVPTPTNPFLEGDPLSSVVPVHSPQGVGGGGRSATKPTPPQIKLPKLTMKRFNGDITKWTTFWDSFSSSIHNHPALSGIEKFNYLSSLLESTAAEAIAGLTLTDANYEEAVATLKRRFGNTQLIINRHMEALLNVPGVQSQQDVKGSRKLHDCVETHMRGLRALRVPASSYGGLLTSVLVSKLPPDLRLIITREMTGESWDLERLMKAFEREVDARERAFIPTSTSNQQKSRPRLSTASTLVTNSSSPSGKLPCVYCDEDHSSGSCSHVTDPMKRKELLRKAGRCFICLRKHHLSRDCRSTYNCRKCRGRHHTSICTRGTNSNSNPTPTKDTGSERKGGTKPESEKSTTQTLHTNVTTGVLLQTAKFRLIGAGTGTICRAIFDSGSQKTYVSDQLRERLKLPSVGTETIQIKTFGDTEGSVKTCDVVRLEIRVKSGETQRITALVVPIVCGPLTAQPIDASKECYEHLEGLDLADSAKSGDSLDVDILIGSDWYWSLVTGKVVKGKTGPVAIHTKVGWILSGPAMNEIATNLTLTSTHTLKIETVSVEPSLDNLLKQFWELESLGIPDDESPVYERFLQQINFDGQRYQVSLPWKLYHSPLPDHYDLCRKRLEGLLRRLRQTPQLFKDYDAIIRDQAQKGIIESVAPSDDACGPVHYLPHHGVVRQDKKTSKLRIVYDASAHSTGPSLNDCLYTGPKFGQFIFDILLRFRCQQVALIGDIEKAFLMVSIQEKDRDALRFLWTSDITSEKPELTTYRFTRVVFGVSSSPFLLNATINHHLETFREADPNFVEKFLSSMYVDDLVSGGPNIQSTHEFYLKSRLRLAQAGFKLRKFVTNSPELHSLIAEDERPPAKESDKEEDLSYAKTSLGANSSEESSDNTKVLGVEWNVQSDELRFDVCGITDTLDGLEPSKRNLVRVAAKFFDPLGVVSPVTILFKMFCQQLCEAKVGWDDHLSGELLVRFNELLAMLKEAKPIHIPRCFLNPTLSKKARLVGFCDASTKAYAAVVYLQLEYQEGLHIEFVASKTRVAPLNTATIPRLELLSALLLAKLLDSIRTALQSEIPLDDPLCFTDSKAALYWIRGVRHDWKQFVENRVTSIRKLIQPECWHHCPGKENPADIPSRGMSPSALSESPLWLNGPDWLLEEPEDVHDDDQTYEIPEDCEREMKRKDIPSIVAVCTTTPSTGMSQIIAPEKFSSSQHLFRVTAFVLRFVSHRSGVNSTFDTIQLSTEEIKRAKLRWIWDMQTQMFHDKEFSRVKLGLFEDDDGLWRCGGRMSNADISPNAQNPILIDKNHHLTALLILDAHRKVYHNGVRETLAELRSMYWVTRGRQVVKKMLHRCVTCRRHEGPPCKGVSPPPLPEFRVSKSRPFQTTGVDYAGPLYVRSNDSPGNDKTWMILYTCYVTRAVHLDLVNDMTSDTFLRSLRRFAARRGMPARIVSDNAKTFKSASTTIASTLECPEVKKFFGEHQVEWRFNLEKAPWQGGSLDVFNAVCEIGQFNTAGIEVVVKQSPIQHFSTIKRQILKACHVD